MFINISNHPSARWSKEQKEAAEQYGVVKDLTFPNIKPTLTSKNINELVNSIIGDVLTLTNEFPEDNILTVMVQGEFIFTFRLVTELKKAGIKTVAAKTERRVIEKVEDGITKSISEFKFAGFMEY